MFASLDRFFDTVVAVAEDRATRVGGMSIHAWAFLVMLSVAAMLPGLASVPVMDRDEARYSQASRQMLETGDFVDIRFQDVPRHVKPAGTYWLQAASAWVAGGPEAAKIWAYRLPSFLAALGAVLVTAWLGARIGGGATGLIAGSLMAVSLILSVEARTAKTDALLLLSVVVAQAALWRVLEREGASRFKGAPLVFWLAHGAGVMIKGPIITLVLGATLLALCLWRRDLEPVRRLKPQWGLPVTLLVIAPWLIGISMKVGGAFLEESVGHALLGKVARGDDAHGAPPGYHTLVFFIGFWPGAILAAMAVAQGWSKRAEPAIRFLICWILPTLIVFELVATKLPHYTLPVYPAVAILAALAVTRGVDFVAEGRWRIAHRVVAGLFLVITALLAMVPLGATLHLQGVVSFSGTLALVFGALTFWAGMRFLKTLEPSRLLTVLAMAMPFYFTTFHLAAPQLDSLWITRDLKAAVARYASCENPVVALAGFAEPSSVFMLGTHTRLGEAVGAAAALRDEPCAVAVVDRREMEAFTEALDGLPVTRHSTIEGLNYSKGREQALTLFTRTP
jgi:4-amino-4-deoxy-L-arabinose transferase-like glycosyltransferase